MAGNVTYNGAKLRAYTSSLPGRAEKLAASLAAKIEAGAKERAPVRTGALRNSIQAQQQAAAVWLVLVGVQYGLWVEVGTHRMSAQPYFIPSIEDVRKLLGPMGKVEFNP